MSTKALDDTVIADRIIDELEADQERIAIDMLVAIAREIGDYGSAQDPELVRADVHEHCRQHIAAFLRSARNGQVPSDEELSFVQDAIVRRVEQEIPLDAVLHAFRVGHQIVWDAIIDRSGQIDGGRGASVLLVRPSMQYIDAVSTRVADAYLLEQQQVVADAARAHRDLLEQLLAGEPEAVAAAAGLGLPIAAEQHHVMLVATAETDDQPTLRALHESISGTFGSRALLVVIRQGQVHALLRAEETRPEGLPQTCAEIVAQLHAEADTSVRIGVGLPVHGIAQIPVSDEQAHAALRLTTAAAPVRVLAEMPAIDYLLSSADDTARALVSEDVRALVASDAATDRALLQTFSAYLAAGLNVQQTAAQLPAHPNTVHYRLRRLTERTGRDLRNLDDVLELAVEVRLLDES